MSRYTPPGRQGWTTDPRTGKEVWTAGKPTPVADLPIRVWSAWRLCFVAGVVDVIGGAAYLWLEPQPGVSIRWFGVGFSGLSLDALGSAGIVGGISIVVLGTLLLIRPAGHRLWGGLVLILSGVGFVTSLYGGLGVGMIAGVVGGILGIRSDPTPIPNDPRRESPEPLSPGRPEEGLLGRAPSSRPPGPPIA